MTGAMIINGKSYLYEVVEMKTRYRVWMKQAEHEMPCVIGVAVKKRKKDTIQNILKKALEL